MPSATVTSKGQVTIPKSIRDLLRLKPGDKVDFVRDDEGRVVVRPRISDIRELKGILRRPGRPPVTIEAMEAAIRHEAAKAAEES